MKTLTRVAFLLLILGLLSACGSYPVDQGPALIVDPGVDPEAWALVPAGEFLYGQFDHEVLIDYDYQIMITEVTNQQFADYLNEALTAGTIKIVDNEIVGYYHGDEFNAYRHEFEIAAGDWAHYPLEAEGLRVSLVGDQFVVREGYENHPVTNVTWFGAEAYCEYQGGRLPTDHEWEKAARGTDGLAFPWGNEISEENANFYSSKDPFELYHGRIGDTTPVGFYNGDSYDGYPTIDSPSPFGLYDVAGNVEEWSGSVHKYEHYRYLHGGSKAYAGYDLRIWVTGNVSPYYFSPSIGFRCAADSN
ncbi:MAG: SUMF1/EgtB/PvdO family nonheme iron enzyme [Chloroflexota bacterium]